MASRQFFDDMAAATALSTQAKRDAAVSKVWAAEAARMADPVPTPVPVPVPPSGKRLFSDASPFNTPIPPTAKWSTWAQLNTTDTVSPYGPKQGYYLSDNQMLYVEGLPSDPLWTLVAGPWGSSDPATIAKYGRNRPALRTQVHAPADFGDRVNALLSDDRVTFLINGTTYWELFLSGADVATKTVSAGVGPPAYPAYATGDIRSSLGAGTLGGLNDGTRASNFSWAAGMIMKADCAAVVAQVAAKQQPRIEHALVVAGTQSWQNNSPVAFVPPATGPEKAGNGKPMGTRFGIPPSVAMPSGLTPFGQALWYAVQTYGMFHGDSVGGQWPIIYGEQGITGLYASQLDPVVNFWGPCDFDKITANLMVVS